MLKNEQHNRLPLYDYKILFIITQIRDLKEVLLEKAESSRWGTICRPPSPVGSSIAGQVASRTGAADRFGASALAASS